MSYGGEKEAERLHRYGYPSDAELATINLNRDHAAGRHYLPLDHAAGPGEGPQRDCPTCRYRRTAAGGGA